MIADVRDASRRRPPWLARALWVGLWALAGVGVMPGGQALADNQTPAVTPVLVDSALPYRITLRPYDLGVAERPTLHSFASARHDGKWMFIGGRTNGLHDLNVSGLGSFPVAFQNREVWVVDPVARQTWHKSLEDPSSGLTTPVVDSLTNTNAQYYQHNGRLYYAGGYGFDRTANQFVTYDTLASIDVAGLMEWVRSATPAAPAGQSIRQVRDPALKVTGGGMHRVGDTTHLVFGHDFSRGYGPNANGVYTNQVRSFRVVDDGTSLSIQDVRSSVPQPEFRRRDLNVIRRLRLDPGSPTPREGLVALSGVFTPTTGAWTVPVTIDADGTPHMADPAAAGTFKQGMNNYTAANVGLFSAAANETHTVIFGGIGYRTYDRASGQFSDDPALPFMNNVTAIVVDAQDNFSQHLMPDEMPELRAADGKLLRLGTNAEFLLADGVPTFGGGLIDLDALTAPRTIGYVFGGLISDAANGGNSVGSSYLFAVDYTPIPEPAAATTLLATAGCAALGRRRTRH